MARYSAVTCRSDHKRCEKNRSRNRTPYCTNPPHRCLYRTNTVQGIGTGRNTVRPWILIPHHASRGRELFLSKSFRYSGQEYAVQEYVHWAASVNHSLTEAKVALLSASSHHQAAYAPRAHPEMLFCLIKALRKQAQALKLRGSTLERISASARIGCRALCCTINSPNLSYAGTQLS